MTRISRRNALAMAMAGAFLPLGAGAQPAGDPRAPVIALYEALERAMKAGSGTPFRARFDALAPVIDRVFDLGTILQVSVGLRWGSLDATARSTLMIAFRSFTVASYVANFAKYEGERFDVGTDVRAIGNDEVVPTKIIRPTAETTRLDYVMRQSPSGWRIVDVLLDGTISRVAVQRSDFRALLGRGDTTALIDSLQRKIADLSGGALG